MRRATCDVWVLQLSSVGDQALTRYLDAADRHRLGRFTHQDDRRRHAGGRSLLRAAVAQRSGSRPSDVQVCRRCTHCRDTAHGKPYLPHRDEHVSITHSGDLVLVAISEHGPVGVDVEQCTDTFDRRPLAVSIVDASEAAPVGAEAFYRTWCRKEAVLKATGDGLSIPLREVRVTAPDQPPALERFPRPHGGIALCDLDLAASHPGYLASLAMLTDGSVAVRLRDGTSLLQQIGPPS